RARLPPSRSEVRAATEGGPYQSRLRRGRPQADPLRPGIALLRRRGYYEFLSRRWPRRAMPMPPPESPGMKLEELSRMLREIDPAALLVPHAVLPPVVPHL